MTLIFRTKDLTDIATKYKNQRLLDLTIYRRPDQTITMTADQFTSDELAMLEELNKGKLDAASARLVKRIAAFRRIAVNPTGIRPGKLEALAACIKAMLEPTEHRWVFTEAEDGHYVAWFVSSVSYNPPDRGRPAICAVELVAYRQHQQVRKVIHYTRDHLQKKTVAELLSCRGVIVENADMVKSLNKEVIMHGAMTGLTGSQFLAYDMGYLCESHYSADIISLERDGQPDRVVMDDEDDECRRKHGTERGERDSQIFTNKYWEKGRSEDEQEEVDDGFVALPIQPYLKVFNFRLHKFVEVHADSLKPYTYTKDLANKLVLPKETKDLISLLLRSVDDLLEDIVRGKTGGVITLATGHPGTGKTLTAEVFAEEIKKPLYAVQCSELGTDETELEERLNKVLERSMRWKAILLLDEADVYVRERGFDLHQNAIVGVFLRVLEYYRGVLFLTSNRQTTIDDAIMSRCSAWIQYDYPTGTALKEHWEVLSKQFEVPLTQRHIEAIMAEFPIISGRTIKNMLKLARVMAKQQDGHVGVETLKCAAKFLKVETNKSKAS